MPTFELLQSEIIHPGRAFTVRRDLVRTPTGHETRLDIIEHAGSVVIVALDAQGNLLFVRQYRHPTGTDLLELPAGTLDKEDEEPEACARREIREETGMGAGNIKALGAFYLAPGYSTEYMHVFLATELEADPLDPDEDEFLTLERIPLPRVLAMIGQGLIMDAKSLAAICLAMPYLQGK